jgi:betaine-aldehyde dehydrogenase
VRDAELLFRLELGGKAPVIVFDDADIAAAAEGIAAAGYFNAGQDCTAATRVLASASVAADLTAALADRARAAVTTFGRAAGDADAWVPPVNNVDQMDRVLGFLSDVPSHADVVAGGKRQGDKGFYVEPTVIADVAPDATIAQEEIFGPVLAIIKAKDFDDALRIANGTEFGLTGAVFTENEDKLDRAREEFFVGNLYLNRKCTGALVGVHPFGGFNMSGTDSKAGGRDYLGLFLQAKSIARKVKPESKTVAEAQAF